METIARFDASEFDGCSPFTEGTTACTARSVEPTRFEYYEDRVKRWDKGEFSKQEAETIEIALKNAQEIKEINLKGTINVAAMKRIGGESESVRKHKLSPPFKSFGVITDIHIVYIRFAVNSNGAG